MVKSCFVHNGPVKIHVLESGMPSEARPSLVVIGGFWESAERALPILSGLPGHILAVSLRGRGLSSTPTTGYDLADHLSDIAAVVAHFDLKNYCVLGFSRGAAYAMGWTLEHQKDMEGLILVDQPPLHTRPVEGYTDYWSERDYFGIPYLNHIRREALAGMEREAVQVDFSKVLSQIEIPVRFFVGRNEASLIPSNVTNDDLATYRSSIKNFETVVFEHSGHMIPDDEEDKYIAEIGRFRDRLGQTG